MFRAGCKHQCTCIDGAVGCAPLCNHQLPPASSSCPYPRLVRIPGQCCFSVDCHQGSGRLPPKHQVCHRLRVVVFFFTDKILFLQLFCYVISNMSVNSISVRFICPFMCLNMSTHTFVHTCVFQINNARVILFRYRFCCCSFPKSPLN